MQLSQILLRRTNIGIMDPVDAIHLADLIKEKLSVVIRE